MDMVCPRRRNAHKDPCRQSNDSFRQSPQDASEYKKKYAKQGASSIKFDDNFFMPKRSIHRPDGATLTEVYESKLQDTWGRIIKAQYIEDEVSVVLCFLIAPSPSPYPNLLNCFLLACPI